MFDNLFLFRFQKRGAKVSHFYYTIQIFQMYAVKQLYVRGVNLWIDDTEPRPSDKHE
jgi:hypothetical protein